MKKLLTMTSVLLAGFFGTAQADVTVSGSANLTAKSVGSKTVITNGGGIAFGLSTTLESGMTISAAGLSLEMDNEVAANSAAVALEDADRFYNITFGMGGSSLTVGQDVEIDYADMDVGGVAAAQTSTDIHTGTSAWTEGTASGLGVAFSTSMGAASISVGHVFDNAPAAGNSNDMNKAGAVSASAFKLSMPVGPLSASIGYHSDTTTSTGVNATAASVAYAIPAGGTLSLAYQVSDSKAADTDAVRMSGKYATSLADGTAVAVGYTSTDQDTKSLTTDVEVSVSKSIGTGASIYIDFHNRTGVGSDKTAASAVAIGTSVAF